MLEFSSSPWIFLMTCFLLFAVARTKVGINDLSDALRMQRGKLNKTQQKVQNAAKSLLSKGSTFTRWGRTSCPAKTQLVYQGYTAGSKYDKGPASNRLCLPQHPEWGAFKIEEGLDHTTIYGAEYEFHWKPYLHKQEVPCAVCLAPKAMTIMVPGRTKCPPGWEYQYSGLLSSNGYGTADFVCLDDEPEYFGGMVEHNGAIFQMVKSELGALHAPYGGQNPVTCVVCSM